MVISFYMKGNNKSTKYELVESLAPSSKIPKADSMDGTIGDIFNKEVNAVVPVSIHESTWFWMFTYRLSCCAEV